MLTGLTEVAGVGKSGEEFWWAAPAAEFKALTLAIAETAELLAMWCPWETAEEIEGVTLELEADEFRKELCCDFMDWAAATTAAAAAEELEVAELLFVEPLLLFLLLLTPLLPLNDEWWLLDLEELLELLPLFDVLRDEDDAPDVEAEPEPTSFELLRPLDCWWFCCWRHLALRFLNHTCKEHQTDNKQH